MCETATVYVPGPMEPDLFGGETPRMIAVEVEAWESYFEWWIGPENDPDQSGSFTLTVAAQGETEAEALLSLKAKVRAPDGASLDMWNMEAFGAPTAQMAEEYRQYRWVMHRNEQQDELREAA